MSTEGTLNEGELSAAVQLLRQVFPDFDQTHFERSSPSTVFSTTVTLSMLTLQRLGGGQSLNAVVKEVLAHNRDLLPKNNRVLKGTLSENSGAYSRARKRLLLDNVEYFTDRVCDALIETSQPWFDGRRAYIIDGTTITLAPTPELRQAFPPATNQHGDTVWPVAMLLVAHEVQSGCALRPEVGAMYGEHNTSEARLARRLAQRIPRDSIVLADAGFGIFSVAWHTSRAGQKILFRLTHSRFKALRKQAELVEKTEDSAKYHLIWKPSPKDLANNPELPRDACLCVQLHELTIYHESPNEGEEPIAEKLYLVTTLPISSAQAGEFYGHRYDVEHDIRDVKVTLNTENIRAKSVDMFYKELWTSFAAYNLVIQFRRQAARLANIPPRRLSFTGVWNTFQSFLLHQPPCSIAQWCERFEDALKRAARDKLPNRPGRSYPRRAHPRRAKSTKFMQQRNKETGKPETGKPEKPK